MSSKKPKGRRQAGTAIAAPPAPAAAPPQQFLHVVKNLLGQVLPISLVDDAGEVQSEHVVAHGLSRAVPLDRISPYTHQLVSRGYARIIQVPPS